MKRLPDTSWSPDQPGIDSFLREAEIVDSGMIASSSNYVFLLQFETPEMEEPGFGVYKPEKGESPLWDFPPSLYKREVATYLISEALGWRLVPPTVERSEGLEHGVGSIQLFIAGDQSCTYFDLRDEHADTMRRFATFDWLTNNADRKGGHILQASDGQLWGIDHGLTLHEEEKLRTVIWDYAGEAVPDDCLVDVAALQAQLNPGQPLVESLQPYLNDSELAMLRSRAAEILGVPTFPQPPDWRRPYPWPLV
ncbi:MAG TPA: hypothetical protein QGF05_05815 [Dehalococcoidia bacterium]|nr:hypothetical protein [Dehalococcoidia bacterium]